MSATDDAAPAPGSAPGSAPVPSPWPWPLRLLFWVLAAAFAVRAARGTPTHRPAASGFARNGHRAWLVGPFLVVPVGLALHPLYQSTQDAPTDPTTAFGALFLATAAATAVLCVLGVVHATRYRAARTRPAAGRVRRAVGFSLLGLAWFLVLLGALVTLPDPTAADYWAFAAVACPLLAAPGALLVAWARRAAAPTTNA